MAARDGYEIVGAIDRGPRSIVYRAHDGPLKQLVALKVFARGSCTREEWEARLRRSGEMWSALGHPNLVAAKRAGWWDGVPYLVEEFVPNGSLAAQLAARPTAVRQALGLVEQLAEIVSYVNRQGMVHGKLKPSNVLFAADGIPRIVDFRPPVGLSIPLPADGMTDAPLSRRSWSRSPIGSAAAHDIYGLGAILYRLLRTGAIRGSTGGGGTGSRIRTALPSGSTTRSHHFWAFCLRCLRKNPWRRYPRTYDVLKRIREFQVDAEGSPSGERGVPRPPRTGE